MRLFVERRMMIRQWSIWALFLAVAVCMTGCAGDAKLKAPEYRKAIIDPADIERVIPIAKEIDANGARPPPTGTPWFEVKKGSRLAIITAPHATQPFREGQYRFADGGATAAMAAALNAVCDVTVLYTTYASPSDPNFYDDNDFKSRLAGLISEIKPVLVLDIHASHPYRPYDIDLGTMNGASLLGKNNLVASLVNSLTAEGILSVSHERFAASTNQTITKYAAAHGVSAIQLEFSATRMALVYDSAVTQFTRDLATHRFAQSLQGLARFLATEGLCAQLTD